MSALELTVLAVLSAWALLTVLNQFPATRDAIVSRVDPLRFVPIWTFFAPNPGQSDYHCVYRDRLSDGSVTDWVEIPLSSDRRPLSFIWNPEKRSKKVLSDLVQTIVLYKIAAQGELGPGVKISLPYLLMLNVISHEPRPAGAEARQFVIAETFGFEATKPVHYVLKSDFHAFDAEVDEPALGAPVGALA